MQLKLFGAIVVVVFVCLKSGYSLHCYECDSESSCRTPETIMCNREEANRLNEKFQMPNIATTGQYECLLLNVTFYLNSAKFPQIQRGCVFRGANICSKWVKPGTILMSKNKCRQCSSYDLCNAAGRHSNIANSAITFVVSSAVVTIMTQFLF